MPNNFPSIGGPSLPIQEERDDPALVSEADGGYEMTRPRFTRIRKRWTLVWPYMTNADYLTLINFYDTTAVGGSVNFNWTNPMTGATQAVRFAGAPDASLILWNNDQSPRAWSVKLTLREV